MRKYDYFWKANKDWYYRKENGVAVIRDDAPKEAKDSYERYRKQKEKAEKEGYMD